MPVLGLIDKVCFDTTTDKKDEGNGAQEAIEGQKNFQVEDTASTELVGILDWIVVDASLFITPSIGVRADNPDRKGVDKPGKEMNGDANPWVSGFSELRPPHNGVVDQCHQHSK